MGLTFLKKVASGYLPKSDSLISAMVENMEGYEPARSMATLHASELTRASFCPREVAILTLLKKPKKGNYVPAALRATFDVGNMTSTLVREKWLGDKAIGNWKCSRCGRENTMTSKPDRCKPEAPCAWGYEEARFEHSYYKVSGGIDVFARLGPTKLTLVELKVIASNDFEKVVAPLGEHRLRTNLYMNLVANSNSPWRHSIDTEKAKVLYVSRGHGKKHESGEILPFREFDVERNDAHLVKLFARAEQLKFFREKGLMPNGICSSMNSPFAKGCNCMKECFSGNYPHQQESFEL